MPDKPLFAAVKIDESYYGLSHLSAAFDIVDVPTDQFKASVASILPSLGSLAKQPDLLYISAILASQGANNNRDYFGKEDLVRAHNTSINKRISDNHGDEIIGHMTSSWLVDDKGTILNNDQALACKDRIHAAIGGVIYKYHYPEMAEDIKNSAGGKGNQKISMEALFPDCALIIGDEKEVVASSDPKFNDIYGYWSNMANYKGKPVYRKLIGHFFSGSGITKNPANPPSIILSAASEKENCDVERGCVLIDFGKKTEGSESCSCKTEAKKENKVMSSESDMKAVAFEVELEKIQPLLTEIYDEAVNEDLSLDDESEAGSRPNKKKKGKRSPWKGYSKNQADYADPANYSFAIDSSERVLDSAKKFFELESLAEYTAPEKLFILRRIVMAANKFNISISDDILTSVHMSASKQNVDEMVKKMNDMTKRADMMSGDEKDKMMMKIKDMKKKIDEMKASVDDGKGTKADLGLVVPETQEVKPQTTSTTEERSTTMADEKEVIAGLKSELAKANEALVAKDTAKDLEIKGLKDEAVKASEKAKADSEKAKADFDKVIAEKDKEISEMKASKVLADRMKELTDAGLVPSAEADAKEQMENIKTMDDKAFSFYKKSLDSVKASKKDPAKDESKAEKKVEVPAPDLSGAKPAAAALNASGEPVVRDIRAEMLEL